MKKRVLFLSDLHCGHLAGLTPPAWQRVGREGAGDKRQKLIEAQRILFHEYTRMLTEFSPYDGVITVGDLVDGKGEKSGGVELITTDVQEQAEIAITALKSALGRSNGGRKAPWITGVWGTGYHGGNAEDWERPVAEVLGFKAMESHGFYDIEGFKVDVKHHTGTSQASISTQDNGLKGDMLWNLLLATDGSQPKCDLVVRGHAHVYRYVENRLQKGFVCPALQGHGSKYGSRRCRGLVDWGMVAVDFSRKEGMKCHVQLAELPAFRSKVLKF